MRTGFGRLQSRYVVVARPPLKKFLRSRRYDGRWKAAGSMSEWRDEINRKALARLDKALPEVFPPPVLTHAMGRRFTPPMPRLAIDSYWRAHPVRADKLARALAAKSGGPAGWTWRLADGKPDRVKRRGRKTDHEKSDWLMWSFRVPPAPTGVPASSRARKSGR
jgi:hypothetical protein